MVLKLSTITVNRTMTRLKDLFFSNTELLRIFPYQSCLNCTKIDLCILLPAWSHQLQGQGANIQL